MAGNEDGSSDVPPEILNMEHEPFGAQCKAHQKIAEVRKLRQFYRKPEGNEERKRLIQEKMKTHPGHACGQLGHWSRECPANKPQEVLATKSRPLPAVPEATVDDGAEWALLASMCQGSKAMPASRLGASSIPGNLCFSWDSFAQSLLVPKGAGVQGDIGYRLYEVGGWGSLGKRLGFRVNPEGEIFKFGDGEVLKSRYRISFVGSFCGKPVVFGFSVVEGVCPPLLSRSGCTQIGAVIDCELHSVAAKKLGVNAFGLGPESGHYTMSIDECDPACVELPADFELLAGLDIMPVAASVLQLERDTDVRLDYLRSTHGCALGHSGVQAMQGTSQDEALPEHPEHTSLPT